MKLEVQDNLVSILMPTYNVENYVEEAVKSILNQTYTNFELIIIDDCSTDHTFEILKKLKDTDRRIKLIRNERNLKICKTLNKGFKVSQGNYILRMDGDDISVPRRLEVMKDYLDHHNEVMLVGSQVISIDQEGKELSRKRYPKFPQTIRKCNQINSSVLHIWLARREVYETLQGYRDIPYAEDYDFLLRGELHGYYYANVDEFLYKVRIRTGNTSSANGLVQRKTAKFVQQLHKKEMKLGREDFNLDEYHKAIACTDVQKKKHARAAAYLNQAITNDRHRPKILIDLIKACVGSKYVFDYLVGSLRFRFIVAMEK